MTGLGNIAGEMDSILMERYVDRRGRKSEFSWELSTWTPIISVLILAGGLGGCASQGEYDGMLRENQSLKLENAKLKQQLAHVRPEEASSLNGDSHEAMTTGRLVRLLSKLAGKVEGKDGGWKLVYKDIPMVVVTSSTHDRMRIVSPIREGGSLEATQLSRLLEANFDRALDGRYALYRGNLWSVYLHPLSSLTEKDLASGLDQVANLVKTYGSTYSSGHLQFQ